MSEKKKKVYEKKILLQSKATKHRLADEEKAQARARAWGSVDSANEVKPSSYGKRASKSSSGYRKHPFHKPTWGKYPHITISKRTSTDGALSVGKIKTEATMRSLNKKMYEIKQKAKKKKKSDDSLSRIDQERSLGNVSIRKVLATLFQRNTDSTYYRVYKISLPWIIKQIARVSLVWEFMIYITIVATFMLTFFTAFFSFYEKELWDWIALADLIFTGDTILRLSVEIWRYRTRATVVVFTAPYTMFQFLFDVCSMIPLHQIYYWIEGSCELGDLSMIDYFRLNRVLRLSRCKEFFDVLERERRADETLLFCFKFAFTYFTSCLFVSSIGVQPLDYLLFNNMEKLEESFLKGFQQNKAGYGSTPWDIFVITTNFATACITTVGYGDVVPNNEYEMTICIVCMLVGAIFLNGYYTSEMTNLRLELDGARFDLYHRLRQIREYLTSINALPFFNAKVEEYYNHLWTYREGVFDVPFMRKFPRTFHEELSLDICLEMFDKSRLFYNLDAAFLRAISKTVTIALYNENMILCRTGSYSGRMFYILQGECQAMSKYNPANASSIIRAGSIIGEANLFFSYPYTTTVETRTCCQFIMLTKQDLLEVMELFPTEMEIIRSRSLQKINELYYAHQAYGVDPVCWVKTSTDMENPSNPNSEKLRINMRWGTGINSEVLDDVVDDSEVVVIFSTPCDDRSVEKNHLIPYISCAVPEILNTKIKWIQGWNYIIIALACYEGFFTPYCLVFSESNKLEYYICQVQFFGNYVLTIIYLVDVFVEILGACPVAGLYYKFWDGLRVVLHKPTFYLDVLAAVPLDIWTLEEQDIFHILGSIFKVLKLWKLIRFLHNLDNVYPLKLFWLRLLQTTICLLYGIHFIAAITYYVACPHDETSVIKCKQMSWLASYEIRFKMNQVPNEKIPVVIKKNTLGYGAPYMFSFFYATATFTSAGFGDFNPQNKVEMLYAIGFQLFGFFLVGYFTAILTSALTCLVRSKLALQQRLVSLYQFMNHYHLREHLKNRIIEHFVLQHQLRGGISLKSEIHLMYDAPAYIRDDVLYLEVYELLDGIPVFSKVEADVIIKLSRSMKLFLIPPNTTFMHMGEVRRILYVIKNGSMGIFEPGGDQPISVLEASSHFGIRDLLFGEPSHYVIRSLSYVTTYEIKRSVFEDALQYEDDFWELVKQEKQRIKQVIHEMTLLYATMGRKVSEHDKATSIPSWVEVPARIPATAIKVFDQVEKSKIEKVNLLNNEFDEEYKKIKKLRWLKYFLLRKTIHPVGYFSKFWNCCMSLVSCLTVLGLTLETFCYMRMPLFRAFQFTLDWINYIDIYLKLHWSYYNPHTQILVTHPVKTAMHYALHGSLAMDVAICAPVELLMWIGGQTNVLGYGRGASWYSKLRWIRLFQVKRIPIIFNIVHNIFKHRSMVLLFLYVILTLFICTMVSTVALFIACPWEANDWHDGDQYRVPMCTAGGWVGFKYEKVATNPELMSGFFRRWILGLYYVSQVILVIGFGDMIILDQADVYLLTFMSIFGFILMRCLTADMTAAEVDRDQARSKFVEQITVLDLVMQREKVHKKLYSSVMSHLYNTWSRSRGLQPRELFSELHPVLESELYGNLVEEKLLKVPIFHTFPPTVLRSIFRYMKTMYVNRGQRLMRFGNLEYEMYVIISGKVYITDQHLNYICNLGAGESFGETSVISGLARRHNAIAACSTELYVLSSHNFETFLGRYPNFKNEMIHNLSSDKQDYFETMTEKKMEAARKLTTDQKHKMLATFSERTHHIKEMVAQKEDPEQSGIDITTTNYNKKGNIFVGRGDLDDDLPFLYFSTKSKKTKFWSYPVIHPNCPLVKVFNTIISWMCFITPAIATYEVCFSSDFLSSERSQATNDFRVSRFLQKIANFIEVSFLIHCIMQFFLAFEVKNGVYNKNPRSISMRYMTSFDGLIFDLVTTIPFLLEKTLDMLLLEFSDFSVDVENLFENLYLLRILRLYHYFRFILGQRNDLSVSTFRLQIRLSVTSFLLMAHMLACLFYWISPCTRPDLTNSTYKFPNLCPAPTEGLDKSAWTTQYVQDKRIATNKEKIQAWRWWFRSAYWVVTTISTTGFGDIVPVTIHEMIVGVICMFCGAFILSIILSQFSSGMASLTKTKREYMYQVNLLIKHLKNIGLSQIRQTQVMMYFRTFWESCRGVPYHKTWRKLPLTMQIEVAYAIFGKTLLKVPFFKDNKEKIFIRQLSIRVTHSLYIPGSYIHKDGDPGTSMYVVYKGLVSGTILTVNNEPELKAIYNPGDAFGRFAALFHDGVYKKSYRAETMVEILEVKRRDILHLARKFPQFKKMIYNFITTKYTPRGINVNIFERQRRKGTFFGIRTEFLFRQAAGGALIRKKNMHEQNATRRKNKKVLKDRKQKMVEEYVKQQQVKEGHPEEVNNIKHLDDQQRFVEDKPKKFKKKEKSQIEQSYYEDDLFAPSGQNFLENIESAFQKPSDENKSRDSQKLLFYSGKKKSSGENNKYEDDFERKNASPDERKPSETPVITEEIEDPKKAGQTKKRKSKGKKSLESDEMPNEYAPETVESKVKSGRESISQVRKSSIRQCLDRQLSRRLSEKAAKRSSVEVEELTPFANDDRRKNRRRSKDKKSSVGHVLPALEENSRTLKQSEEKYLELGQSIRDELEIEEFMEYTETESPPGEMELMMEAPVSLEERKHHHHHHHHHGKKKRKSKENGKRDSIENPQDVEEGADPIDNELDLMEQVPKKEKRKHKKHKKHHHSFTEEPEQMENEEFIERAEDELPVNQEDYTFLEEEQPKKKHKKKKRKSKGRQSNDIEEFIARTTLPANVLEPSMNYDTNQPANYDPIQENQQEEEDENEPQMQDEEEEQERQKRMSLIEEEKEKRRIQIEEELNEALQRLKEEETERFRRRMMEKEARLAEWERRKQEKREKLWEEKEAEREKARLQRREERERRKHEERERRRDQREQARMEEREQRREQRAQQRELREIEREEKAIEMEKKLLEKISEDLELREEEESPEYNGRKSSKGERRGSQRSNRGSRDSSRRRKSSGDRRGSLEEDESPQRKRRSSGSEERRGSRDERDGTQRKSKDKGRKNSDDKEDKRRYRRDRDQRKQRSLDRQ